MAAKHMDERDDEASRLAEGDRWTPGERRDRAGGAVATALIVDFGGVLTTDIWTAFDAFCHAEGLEPGLIKNLFRSNPEAIAELRRLERGEVEDEDFERRFGELLGVSSSEGLITRLFAGLEPNEAMIEAVRTARRQGIRTGLISNSWGTGIYERARFDIFDAAVISGEVGLHKPEPEIYRLAAERLETAPERCIFVDDLRENCAGAEAVGMQAVLHRDTDRTLAELERRLAVGLTSPQR